MSSGKSHCYVWAVLLEDVAPPLCLASFASIKLAEIYTLGHAVKIAQMKFSKTYRDSDEMIRPVKSTMQGFLLFYPRHRDCR